MTCSKESRSSLFSRSHSAVSLRANRFFFFFKSLKKLHPLGVFISDPHVSRELIFLLSGSQIYFLSSPANRARLPLPFLQGPPQPPAPFSFPLSFKGKFRKPSGRSRPHLLRVGHQEAAGDSFSWPPGPQRTKSESVMAFRGKDLKPERPLSTRHGREGRGTTSQPPS